MVQAILESDKNAIFDKDEDDNTPLHLGICAMHLESLMAIFNGS